MKKVFFYSTSIGNIGIAADETAITNFYFDSNFAPKEIEVAETPLIQKAASELKEYLAGKRKEFDLVFAPEGTAFQQRVWKALQEIPYGTTKSYKDIATAIGNPKASRAVGMANNKNPIAIFIPCHRVIGANGKLVGYASGLAMKEKLLDMEADYGTSQDEAL